MQTRGAKKRERNGGDMDACMQAFGGGWLEGSVGGKGVLGMNGTEIRTGSRDYHLSY